MASASDKARHIKETWKEGPWRETVLASTHLKRPFLPTRPWIGESHIAMIMADYTEIQVVILDVPVLIRVGLGLDNHHSDLGRNQ